MEWTFRAVVRAFLLVGGIAYLVYGVVEGGTFDVVLGAFAAVVGAIGLWSMRLQVTGEDGDPAGSQRPNTDRKDDDPAGGDLDDDDLESHGLAAEDPERDDPEDNE